MRRYLLSPAQFDALDAVYLNPQTVNRLLGRGHRFQSIRSLERRKLVTVGPLAVDGPRVVTITAKGRDVWVDDAFPVSARALTEG